MIRSLQAILRRIKEDRRVRGMLLVMLFILVAGTCMLMKSSGLCANSAVQVRNWIVGFGWMGPVVYVFLFTLVPLTLFPDAVLAVASGLAFGFFKGALLTWLGALCGATLSFYISRLAGKDAFQDFLERRGHKHGHLPATKGFFSVLLLRLVPLVPFDLISYGAGLSSIRYREFIAATALGIIPGVAVYVNLGDTILNGLGPSLYCAVLILGLLIGLTTVAVRYFRRKYPHLDTSDSDSKKNIE